VNLRTVSLLLFANLLLSACIVGAYAHWYAPSTSPALAVLDVGELYRLKETQVATVLVKRDASDADRSQALKHAAAFGLEVTRLIDLLPEECRCLILARGVVVGPAPQLPDLTPEVRRRLGL
jgi:hypothetical protein